MYIDSSALVALLTKEPDWQRVTSALDAAATKITTPLVRVETVMVLATRLSLPPEGVDRSLSALFIEAGITVEPVTDAIGHLAVVAFARYGKGRGHPARLNFADCMIYAAAKAAKQPLLFIGDDFTHTDIKSVLRDPRPRSATN